MLSFQLEGLIKVHAVDLKIIFFKEFIIIVGFIITTRSGVVFCFASYDGFGLAKLLDGYDSARFKKWRLVVVRELGELVGTREAENACVTDGFVPECG